MSREKVFLSKVLPPHKKLDGNPKIQSDVRRDGLSHDHVVETSESARGRLVGPKTRPSTSFCGREWRLCRWARARCQGAKNGRRYRAIHLRKRKLRHRVSKVVRFQSMGVVPDVRNRGRVEKVLRETLQKRRRHVSRRKSRFRCTSKSRESGYGDS